MRSISETLSVQGKPKAPTRNRKGINNFSHMFKISEADTLLKSTAQYGKWKELCQKDDDAAAKLADMVIERHDLLKKAKSGLEIDWAGFDQLTGKIKQRGIHLFSSSRLEALIPSPSKNPSTPPPLSEINPATGGISSPPPLQPSPRITPAPLSQDDAMIMDIRSGQYILTPALLGYKKGESLFLPLGEFTRTLDFNIAEDAEKGTAGGWFMSEDRTFNLDTNTRSGMVAGEPIHLSKESFFIREGEIYVDTRTLSSWFPVDFNFDFAQQSLSLHPREELPFQTRLARESSWKADRSHGPNQPRLPLRESANLLFGPPFVDMGLSASHGDAGTADQGWGADYHLLGRGDLGMMNSEFYLSGDEENGLDTARLTLEQNDPHGELLGPLRATNFAAGDIRIPRFPIVGGGKYEKGVTLGNQPLHRSSEYDTTFFEGDLSPGWDVEVYRNNILLNTQRVGSDGRYSFEDVPIYYGKNDFKLIFYGPQGQKRTKTKHIMVGNEMIKKGTSEYQLFLTQKDEGLFDPGNIVDTRDRDTLRLMAKYKFGLARDLSVEGGLLSQEINRKRHNYLHVGAQSYLKEAYVSAGYIHDTEGGDAVEALVQKKVGPLDFKLKQQFFKDFVEEGDTKQSNKVKSRTDISAAGSIPETKFTPVMPFAMSFNDTERDESHERSIAARLSTNVKGVYINNNLQWRDDSSYTTDSPTIEGSTQTIAQLGKIRLRGGMDYDLHPESRITKAQVSGLYAMTNHLNSELTLTQDMENDDEITGTLGFNWNNGKYILSPQVSYDSQNQFKAFLSFSTSFGMEPRSQRLHFSSSRYADGGAVSARVFHDENNNKIFDNGDVPIQGATIKADQSFRKAETNEDGIAFLTGLRKYHPTDITLERESLEDPFWEPSQEGSSIVPRPGHVEIMDIPVVTTGEVDGTLYMENEKGERTSLNQVPVQLLDQAGKIIQKVKSEYDGFYLFMKIPPGDYFVRLDPAYETNLGVTGHPPLPVKIGNDGTVVSGSDLVFKKSSTTPASQESQSLQQPHKPESPTPSENILYGKHEPLPDIIFPKPPQEQWHSPWDQEEIEKTGTLLPKPSQQPQPPSQPQPSPQKSITLPSAISPDSDVPSAQSTVAMDELSPVAKPGPAAEPIRQIVSGTQHYGLHLSSYRTAEKAIAGIQFQKKKFKGLLETKDFTIQKADLGPEKGIWYRVLAGSAGNMDKMQRLAGVIKNRHPYCKMVSLEDPLKKGVHLTSFRTKAQAKKGIQELKEAYPALLRNQEFTIKTVDLGPDKGVWQRVIAGSFTNKSQARELIAKIKQKAPYCKPMEVESKEQFAVHMASYRTSKRAVAGLQKLENEFGSLLGDQFSIRRVDLGKKKGVWYRVLAGRFNDKNRTKPLQAGLRANKQYARAMDFSFMEE